MELTPLEIDLLGDMAQDAHAAREVVGFVRLHHGDDPGTVERITRELLATWHARGWITIADGPPEPYTYRAAGIPELLGLLEGADLFTPTWLGADTWLQLTDQAFRDQPWTAPAS